MQAVQHLERAVELVDEDPTLIEHLGDAYHKTGRIADASRIYREAIQNTSEESQIQRLRTKLNALALTPAEVQKTSETGLP